MKMKVFQLDGFEIISIKDLQKLEKRPIYKPARLSKYIRHRGKKRGGNPSWYDKYHPLYIQQLLDVKNICYGI
jgi:hypothetical protein